MNAGRRLLVAALLLAAAPALAQPANPPATRERPAEQHPADGHLPADAVTHHTLALPNGQTLHFTATAGGIRLTDPQGKPQAELAFIAYTLDGADQARPVTFAMNGGPGSASAWVQLGAMGPWRLPLSGDAARPSAAPVLVDNAQTWLDFTDLVFLDPAGTGYSRLADDSEPLRKQVWSLNGDVSTLADAIRRWLQTNNRLASPKYFAGESYSGLRGPRLVRTLATEQGIGLSGMVLISPIMDYGLTSNVFDPMTDVIRLPSMAAAAHGWTPDQLQAAEAYATGDYLQDLLRGQDPAALEHLTAHVADLTELPAELIRRLGGHVSPREFLWQRSRASGQVGSVYDPTLTEADPFPESAFPSFPDPTFALYTAPMTEAMIALVNNRLNWHPDGRYMLSNDRANREWNWGNGIPRPESISALRTALAIDPGFRVLIGHGIYDLVTPYMGTKLRLAQFPEYQPAGRLRLALHPGGHMFYTRDDQRAVLHDEARALVTGQ